MNSPPFFQNVTIDMPVDEEGALETIEQLRDRYDTLLLVCFKQWQMFPLTSFIVQHLHEFLLIYSSSLLSTLLRKIDCNYDLKR